MYLFCHVDPIRRELLYIGVATNPTTCRTIGIDLTPEHKARLHGLIASGVPKDRICHVLTGKLSVQTARQLKRALIKCLNPPGNVQFTARWKGNPVLPALLDAEEAYRQKFGEAPLLGDVADEHWPAITELLLKAVRDNMPLDDGSTP